MFDIAIISKTGAAIVAAASVVALWNGYRANENAEMLNNYEQAQALARTIGNHNRDKLTTDIAIADITIRFFETAVDKGDELSAREIREYEIALASRTRWEESLEDAEEYLSKPITFGVSIP